VNARGRGHRRLVAALGAALVAFTTLVAVSGASTTAMASTPSALSCWAASTTTSAAVTQSIDLAVSGAPSQALPGATFTITLADQGQTVPTTILGDPVTSVGSLVLTLPLPAGTTFQSATLSGGTNVGTGATVAEQTDSQSPSGFDLVETVPGPITAGQTFALPAIDLTISASTTVGTTITPTLLDVPPVGTASASADPTLSAVYATTTSTGTGSVTDTCWPATSPAPALSTTTVVAVDTLPPTIDLTSPTDGAVYTVGQVVDAAYTCSDVASYGIATCVGTVADGAAIDTSTVGTHTFVVNATDLRGTPASTSVSYYVRAATGTYVTGPTDAGAVPLASGASCSFGGATCPVTTPPEATYQVTSPVPNGGDLVIGDTFTVQWQVYKPGMYSTAPGGGPLVSWTVPAPAGTVIEGPVTTSTTGLLSPTAGQGSLLGAGACTDATCTTHSQPTGLININGQSYIGTNPAYVASQPLTSLTTTWADSSSPTVGSDGLYLDLTYTVKVVAPGAVTLGGFPSITGTGLSSVAVADPGGISFTAIDPTPPTVSITTPVNGASYTYGQAVAAAYTCSDPIVTITSCVGTVANGADIDTTTATPGSIHTFSVTATDSVGNTATSTVEYYVAATPPTTNPSSYTVATGSSATLHVLSADTPTDYAIDPTTVKIVSQPAYGTATVNTDGTITYTNTNVLSLTDSFTYTVADIVGNVSTPATVSITMQPPLDVVTASSLPQGLILQQQTAVPTDVLGATLGGGTCSGPPVTLDGQTQSACGQLSPVTVINDGGVDGGWTLSGQVSDFVDPSAPAGTTCNSVLNFSNRCIPGGNLGWSPTATITAPLAGYPGQVQAGGVIAPVGTATSGPVQPQAGLSAAPQVLCQAPALASQGSFSCGAGLVLPVPASAAVPQAPGYQATLTLTLS